MTNFFGSIVIMEKEIESNQIIFSFSVENHDKNSFFFSSSFSLKDVREKQSVEFTSYENWVRFFPRIILTVNGGPFPSILKEYLFSITASREDGIIYSVTRNTFHLYGIGNSIDAVFRIESLHGIVCFTTAEIVFVLNFSPKSI